MALLDSIGRRNNASDLMGLEVGRLKVIAFSGNRNQKRLWLCRCTCGGEKVIAAYSLKSGLTLSCGCLRREIMSKHRDCSSPEYNAWKGIKRRCLNTKSKGYRHYGGRGITVCGRWRDSYESFLADVGRRPSAKHSIDRIDNDGNYEPNNVRWATRPEQARNRRDNQFIEYDGERLTVAEWARRLGMTYNTLRHRLMSWGTKRALMTPLIEKHACRRHLKQ